MQDLSFIIYFITLSVFAILTIERPIKSINNDKNDFRKRNMAGGKGR